MRPRHAILMLPALLAAPALATEFDALPGVDQLPRGYVSLGEVLPSLGEPYAVGKPGFHPAPPTYFVYKNKIIGVSFTLDGVAVQKGLSVTDLDLPAGMPPVDHIDLVFDRDGHNSGLPANYQLMTFFVSADFLTHSVQY